MRKVLISGLLMAAPWAALPARAQIAPVPVLSYPKDAATGVTVYVTLKWRKAQNVTLYHVQMSLSPAFDSLYLNDSAVADTSFKMARLADSTTYYWKVRAANASGWGAYSKARAFTTQGTLAAGPVLTSPPDYSADIPESTELTWEAYEGATAYHLQVSLSNNFADKVLDDSTLKTTSKAIGPLLKGTPYYWHVRALGPNLKTNWTKGTFFTAADVGVRPFFTTWGRPGPGLAGEVTARYDAKGRRAGKAVGIYLSRPGTGARRSDPK